MFIMLIQPENIVCTKLSLKDSTIDYIYEVIDLNQKKTIFINFVKNRGKHTYFCFLQNYKCQQFNYYLPAASAASAIQCSIL